MSTILESLQNADYNLNSQMGGVFAETLGKEQLSTSVALLQKGYDLHTDVEQLIAEHGGLSKVPEHE